ncbi:MAG: hypothetical protein ACSHYA_06325 [Opitutaceae bacterium]
MRNTWLQFLACFFVFFGSFLNAEIGFLGTGSTFKAADGSSAFPDEGLMQLINLGDDGLLNPILEGAWTSGDDVLIDLPYGTDTEFATSGAFDLSEGAVVSPGFFQRQFEFLSTPGVIEEGDLIALRWWPTFTALGSIGGALPAVGDLYGEIRIAVPVNDPVFNTAWAVPADGEPLAIFDPAISDDFNQSVGNSLLTTPGFTGAATEAVQPVPEPAFTTIFMGLLAVLTCWRRSP